MHEYFFAFNWKFSDWKKSFFLIFSIPSILASSIFHVSIFFFDTTFCKDFLRSCFLLSYLKSLNFLCAAILALDWLWKNDGWRFPIINANTKYLPPNCQGSKCIVDNRYWRGREMYAIIKRQPLIESSLTWKMCGRFL